MSDNPPAFPCRFPPDSYAGQGVTGMSLRDWFAGQAFSSGLIRPSYPDWQLHAWFGNRTGITNEEIAAKAAYAYADALLAEREKSA